MASYNTGDSSDFSNIITQWKALNKDSENGTSRAPNTTTTAPSPRVQELRTVHPPPRVPQPTPITVVPPTAQEKGKRKNFKDKSSSSQKRCKRTSPHEGPLLSMPFDSIVRVPKRVRRRRLPPLRVSDDYPTTLTN